MILDGFGLQGEFLLLLLLGRRKDTNTTPRQGQVNLKKSSVIVVGAGGLGCPALQYLAAAGVGEAIHF